MKAALVACGVLLALSLQSAVAQQVYRCGADGRTYQNAPCPQGKAVDVADPRSAEQQKSARAAAKVDARLAGDLERDRVAREKGLPPAKASGFNARPAPPQPVASANTKTKKKRKAETSKAASSPELSPPAVVPKAKAPAADTRKP